MKRAAWSDLNPLIQNNRAPQSLLLSLNGTNLLEGSIIPPFLLRSLYLTQINEFLPGSINKLV